MIDWRQTMTRLEGAYSDHTLRRYRSDFSSFEKWCMASGKEALPGEPLMAADYPKPKQELLKPSTPRRHTCAIRKIHPLCSLPDPTGHKEVFLALGRTRRRPAGRPKLEMSGGQDLECAVKEPIDLLRACRGSGREPSDAVRNVPRGAFNFSSAYSSSSLRLPRLAGEAPGELENHPSRHQGLEHPDFRHRWTGFCSFP